MNHWMRFDCLPAQYTNDGSGSLTPNCRQRKVDVGLRMLAVSDTTAR